VDTINDSELWHEVENSFKTMNFSTTEVDAILYAIATILHLGNVDFDESTFTDNSPCQIKNDASLESSAKVL
jgi:myosin heavy subunit